MKSVAADARISPTQSMSAVNGQTPDPELRFSLVIPVHNEAENIESLLDEIEQVLTPCGPIEVLRVRVRPPAG